MKCSDCGAVTAPSPVVRGDYREIELGEYTARLLHHNGWVTENNCGWNGYQNVTRKYILCPGCQAALRAELAQRHREFKVGLKQLLRLREMIKG